MLRALPVLFIVSLATFFMTDLLPGGPALAMLGENATPEDIASLNRQYGFDKPFVERYVNWVDDAVHLDLGTSFATKQRVTAAIKERLPVTVQLALGAQLIALVVAISLALTAAARANTRFDRVVTAAMAVVVSIPGFLTALLLTYVFAMRLNWLPVTGWSPWTGGVWNNLKGATLPMVTLALPEIAAYQRVLRNDALATLQEDFVSAARAKGLSQPQIMVRHVLRPSSFSLITLAGVSLGRFMAGAVIVETVFALPGLGQLVSQGVGRRDVIMVQGLVMFIAFVYVAANLFVEFAYALLDPRVRRRTAR